MTYAEYLALEEASETKHEFVDGEVRAMAGGTHAATNPIVIVEVLSPNTEADDRGEKWAHYQAIPSLRHYVLVSQHRPRVEVYTRTDLGWHYAEVLAGGAIALSTVDALIPLDELYASRLGG